MNTPIPREGLGTYLWLLIPALLVASMAGSLLTETGPYNLYAFQAQAFLSGRLDIPGDPATLPGESIEINGSNYIPFPPFPALLLTPFVALFGVEKLKITLLTATLACISCLLLRRILRRLDIDSGDIFWMLAAFALGTAYWWVLRGSMWVWMFAQIVCVLFVFLSINEMLGGGRGWLAGLLLGCAFLSRPLAIYTSTFLVSLIWENGSGRKRVMNLAGFLAGVGVCITVYLAFNYLRWETWGTGYAEIGVTGFSRERMDRFGLFSPAYLFFNSIYMFVQGFHLDFGGADHLSLVGIDPFGASLLSASPFVIAAFRAKWKRAAFWGAWLAIGLSLFHMLLYHNNGYIQFNSQRFTLDFLPVLIILAALGLKSASPDLAAVLKFMVVYSIALNLLTFILVG